MNTPQSFRSIALSKSLSMRLFFSVALWLLCAVVFTGYTLLLSWQLENGGIAINDAGSLRKRTFQMALLHNQAPSSNNLISEQLEFEQVLSSLAGVGHKKLFLSDNQELRDQVSIINAHWKHNIVPWYTKLIENGTLVNADNRLLIDDFANEINQLVKLIEDDNTRIIRLLRLFQMLLIVMTVATAVTGIYLLYRLVIRPLDTLRGGIQRLKDGDLNSRVMIHTEDEFGLVSTGFNQMATRLQDLYTNLEHRVAHKTQALATKNKELRSLYEMTAFLHESHTREDMSRGFIERMLLLTGADAGSVRMQDVVRRKLDFMAHIGLPEQLLTSNHCTALDGCFCGASINKNVAILRPKAELNAAMSDCALLGFTDLVVFSIRFHTQELGLFSLYFKRGCDLDEETKRLIETLCSQVGVALENQRLIARDRQFAVSEERNLMAQGLHDSIAQSLSFLNLQVQMLESALNKGQLIEAQENLTFIKDGVQESYDDVRELLLNFRTRLSKQDFMEVVHTLLNRFELQAQVQTELEITGDGPALSPQQQLQAVFILQEALSNIRKHAHAKHAFIHINNSNHGDFIMRIRDDGVGLDADAMASKRARHVGTAIMLERAQLIHAELQLHSQIGEGTVVELILPSKER